MKKYYWEFQLPIGEFPKCKKCETEGFFTDEFGIVDDEIYCLNCIEQFELKDKKKIDSDNFHKDLKPYISKHHKIVFQNFKFKTIFLEDWDEMSRDYTYYTNEAINEFSYLLALRELQNLKENKTEHRLDSVILKYEQFMANLTKIAISEVEDFYLKNKPSIHSNH